MESPPQLSRPHSHISNFNSRMPAATIITSENYPNNLLKFEDSLIDEREQRIIDFLGSQGVEFKNPMEKFYDYCENIRKEGCSVTSLKSKTSCNSITTEDNEKTPKKDNNQKSFVLSSTLYKKRKLGLNTIG